MIRYEDLVSDPQQIIRSTTSLIDGNELDIDGLDNSSVTLGKSHVVAGNPNRFAVGPIKIAEDNVWKTDMPKFDKLVVSSLTFPLLRQYDYLRSQTDGDPQQKPSAI